MNSEATRSNVVHEKLKQSVQFLPSVGPERARALAKLGVQRAADLLFLFPRRYEAAVPVAAAEEFQENVRVSLIGRILEVDERITQSGKHMLGAEVRADSGVRVRLVWFNQPFRKTEVIPGRVLQATGVLRSTVLHWEMVQPKIRVFETDAENEIEKAEVQKPLPVYPLTDGLKQLEVRRLMRVNLPELIPLIEEVMPPHIRQSLAIEGIAEALMAVHFPEDEQAAEAGLRRFKMQELFVLQLAIHLGRTQREAGLLAPQLEATGKIHSRILNRFSVQPTADQLRSMHEIAGDMARSTPMNRLLQGDVGSGKTLVAQYAMLLCVAYGYQAALMAPTEVLARQHASTLSKQLASSRVRIALLTGSLSRGERRRVVESIEIGEADLVVGTQALLSGELRFKQLGLVIVDEQHKFGVRQRAQLRVDGAQPHYLVLSATPIPRTIAMTAFGELDISSIREKPPGRAAVHTYIASPQKLDSWWHFVDRQIESGRQAYVIAPRVADSVGSELASAEGVFQELSSGPFRHRSVGLLHGKLEAEEKERVLEAFSRHELNILVSTTVVEVGIDVPNATVMTILDADRLGLSQLHQLRGRVSRGQHTGFVCAIGSTQTSPVEASPAARSPSVSSSETTAMAKQQSAAEPHPPLPDADLMNERLQAFAKSDDGFALAEMDLALRGPGDLLGTSQSGLPPLRVANLATDKELIDLARQQARQLLTQDPNLQAPELAGLKRQLMNRYGDALELGDVG